MQFDDRLTTVLNQPASTRRDKAVRWRQLVDLVARSGIGEGSPVLDRALERIAADSRLVEQASRAAAARAISALPIRMELLEIFARDKLAVSAPIFAAAMLEQEQWDRLAGLADAETRRFIETIHPPVAADAVPAEAEPPSTPPPPSVEPEPEAPNRSLADVVAGIERRRRLRREAQSSRKLGGGDGSPALFRWECGPSGDIQWVEGAPRGALIGRSIAQPRPAQGEGPAREIARAFAMRSPFREGLFTIAGEASVAGDWMMSGVPAFEPADGRFAGYRGIAQRNGRQEGGEQAPVIADPASLRELVHEIKTPLTAIMGFAEIIDGEYLGPADQPYRERAAHIVAQSRLLLGAIDDLDFAAKILASTRPEDARTDLRQTLTDLLPELRVKARERGADVQLARGSARVEAIIPPALAERVARTMLSAVLDHAGEGETLRLSVDRSGERCRVSLSRPDSLQSIDKDDLFELEPGAGPDGLGSSNFSLRLARGLARVAGVSLVAGDRDFGLLFRAA